MIISKEHFAPATTPKKDISFPAILRPFKCDHLVRLGQDYDGGYIVNREDIDKSDIILVGVSRTSKTPTSIYLANKGFKRYVKVKKRHL